MMYLPVASLLYDDVVHALRDRPAAAAAPPLVVGKVLPAPFACAAAKWIVAVPLVFLLFGIGGWVLVPYSWLIW